MLVADDQPLPPLLDTALHPEESITRELRGDADGPAVDLDDPRELPAVRIEQPRAQPALLIPDITLPPVPNGARVYVVRFDISLRAKPRVRIEWARFRVQFLSDAAGRSSAVEDQHPFLVERTMTHHVSLTINPSLKFQEIEASVGSYAHSYDYESLEATISAAGRGGTDLTWDYSAGPDATITGGKRMHALLVVPADMPSVRASLSIVADLRTDRFLLPAKTGNDDDQRLNIEIVAAG